MGKNKEKLEELTESLRLQHADINVYNFLSLLHTYDVVNRYLDIEMRKIGLDRTKMRILNFLLANNGTMTPTELSNSTLRSKDTITKAIDILDRLGLTKSTGTKRDRRLRKVTITNKGLDFMERFLPIRQQVFAKATDCLKPEDAAAIRSILKQLRENILKLMENSGDQLEKRPDQISTLLSLLDNNTGK